MQSPGPPGVSQGTLSQGGSPFRQCKAWREEGHELLLEYEAKAGAPGDLLCISMKLQQSEAELV